MVVWVFPCCILFSIIQDAKCSKVFDKVRDDILHASSYAAAYQKYVSEFHTSDNQNHGVMSRQQQLKMQEKEKRKQKRFIMSVKQANKHNKNFNEGLTDYTQTVNEFSIMDEDERHDHLGLQLPNNTDDTEAWGRMKRTAESPLIKSTLPNNFDWEERGFVTRAKNQGKCGACWSFAAVVVLEYIYKTVSTNLISLSEQELLDCVYDLDESRNGCLGGFYNKAFKYTVKHGIPRRSDAPYQGIDLPCTGDRSTNTLEGVLQIDGFKKIPPDSIQDTMYAIVNYGPVASAMYVGDDFYSYSKGVYDGCKRDISVNHAVTIVGYSENAWRAKNSWGKLWGLDGFFLSKRHNVCKLLTYGMYVDYEADPSYVPTKDPADESKESGESDESADELDESTDKPRLRCKDRKEREQWHCEYWKTLGKCNKKFMAEYCTDTCGLCEVESKQDSAKKFTRAQKEAQSEGQKK